MVVGGVDELDVDGEDLAVASLDHEVDLAFAAMGSRVMDAGRQREVGGLVQGQRR